jgi:NitT/TauT family transport system substrate-binding protein
VQRNTHLWCEGEFNMAASSTSQFDIRIAPNPPVFDLPVLVALEEGLFAKHGINLSYAAGYNDREKNPHEQQPLHRLKESLFEQGQADTYNVCEWGSIDRIERGKEQRAKIAALRPAVAAQAIISFDNALQVPRDLADVEIGINDFTGSHYTTLQLLEGALGRDHVKTVHVGEPSHRYEQVKSGAIRAATVMEPFISLALKEGGHVIALTFYRGAEVIHPRFTAEQRAAYFAALNEAVDRINADFGKYAHHVVKIAKGRLRPEELGRQFIHYVHAANYELEKFEQAYHWMESWKLTAGRNSHASLVTN